MTEDNRMTRGDVTSADRDRHSKVLDPPVKVLPRLEGRVLLVCQPRGRRRECSLQLLVVVCRG
jgi:hypothetical protein